jgi:hypothetical protein
VPSTTSPTGPRLSHPNNLPPPQPTQKNINSAIPHCAQIVLHARHLLTYHTCRNIPKRTNLHLLFQSKEIRKWGCRVTYDYTRGQLGGRVVGVCSIGRDVQDRDPVGGCGADRDWGSGMRVVCVDLDWVRCVHFFLFNRSVGYRCAMLHVGPYYLRSVVLWSDACVFADGFLDWGGWRWSAWLFSLGARACELNGW